MTGTVLIFRDGASYFARVWNESEGRYLTSGPCRNRVTAVLYGDRLAAWRKPVTASEPGREVPAGE